MRAPGHRKFVNGTKVDETLEAHLHKTEEYLSEFANQLPLAHTLQRCGLWHDLGKNCPEFQKRLAGGPSFDHSSAGAQHAQATIPHRQSILRDLISYAIAGHHIGMPNGRIPKEVGGRTLQSELEKPIGEEGIPEWNLEVPPEILDPPTELEEWGEITPFLGKGAQSQKIWALQLLGRMLFSCLVDADFLATEEFMRGSSREEEKRKLKSQKTLFDNLKAFVEEKERNVDKTPLNIGRKLLRESVWKTAKSPRGFKTLKVPTGGGKTFLSIGYALLHNIQHSGSRIIYTAPYTAILDENVATLRTAVQDIDSVLEHHHNIAEERDSPQNHLLSENWDAPIVATTHVQLFDSLFANRPGACRKLHNLIGATIIIDEIQKIPTHHLKPILATLKLLVESYGATIIFCSATQPILDKEHCKECGISEWEEIAPKAAETLFQGEGQTRTKETYIGDVSIESLAAKICAETQTLCIVNSRRKCRELFNSVTKNSPHALHLSTWMTPKDRKKTISEVRRRLKGKEPILLISTSLIEAGVNLDFPTLFREIAGCDSIAQAAGRCNREGTLLQPGQVYIFALPGKNPQELQMAITSAKSAGNLTNWIDEKTLHTYFDLALWKEGQKTGLDKKGITTVDAEISFIKDNNRPELIINFENISSVRCIENTESTERSITNLSPNEWETILQELSQFGYLSRTAKRKIQQNSFSLIQTDTAKWIALGKIIEDENTTILRLSNPELDYDPKLGAKILGNTDQEILTF